MSKQKKGLVPELRFPEFRNDESWKALTLGELSARITEKVGTKKLTTVSITAGVGFVSQAEKFSRDISGNQYKNYIHLRKGEYSYNKGNSKTFPQGCIYKLQEFDEAAAPNAFINFRFKKNHVGDFFRGYFDSNYHGRQLMRFITSGARSDGLLNIGPDDFFSIVFPTPLNNVEQQKIADCLAYINELITLHTKKLDALKAHKKGLIQQLFPDKGKALPKLRFSEFRDKGKWKKISAGQIFSNRTERGVQGLPIYSVTMNDGMVPRASLKRKIDDISESSANKLARKGDIVYNMMRMWQGALGVAPEDCLVSPAYVVLEPKICVDSLFFCFFFKMPDMLQVLTAYSRGLTEDRLRLYYDDFSKIPLLIPSLTEQQKITHTLKSVEQSIEVCDLKLASLINHKKGLMQKLFPLMDDVI